MKLNKVLLLALVAQLGTTPMKADVAGALLGLARVLKHPFTVKTDIYGKVTDSKTIELGKHLGNVLIPNVDDVVEHIPNQTLLANANNEALVTTQGVARTAAVALLLAKEGHDFYKNELEREMAKHAASQAGIDVANRVPYNKDHNKHLLHPTISHIARIFVREHIRVKAVALADAISSKLGGELVKAQLDKAKALLPDNVRQNALAQKAAEYALRKAKETGFDLAFDYAWKYGANTLTDALKKKMIA